MRTTAQRKAVDEARADAQRLGEENKGLRAKLDQATKDRDEAAKARDVAAKATAETAAVAAPPPAPSASDAPMVVGGIKLITVIGGGAPAPSAAEAKTPAP